MGESYTLPFTLSQQLLQIHCFLSGSTFSSTDLSRVFGIEKHQHSLTPVPGFAVATAQ